MRGIGLYMRFVGIYMKTKVEYDHFFVFMDFVLNSIWPVVNMAMLWLVLERFETIGGWNFDQLLFLYNLSHLSYMICAMIIWNPTKDLPDLVRSGGFDAYLTRPISPLAHMIMRQFSHGHLFGLVLSIGMMVYSVNRLDLPITIGSVALLLSIVFGGAMIYGSVMLVCGSLSFWFVKTDSIYGLFVHELRRITEYPLPIFGKFVKAILLFVVPYGYVNYVPALNIAVEADGEGIQAMQLLLTPVLGLAMFSVAYLIFKRGINKYQSTGS
ncbi:ABC transporter permease [Cohnella yongneupensis]|uniref:ABC transporter permease n=1 Tax=Cohnella yongneupensis TaxID=425006 RepID=A0ABW0R086_9BACL